MEFKDSWWRPKDSHWGYPEKDMVAYRNGIKVGWLLYSSKEGAEAASVKAVEDGRKRLAEGYDFGYQSVGSVTEVADGWQVVIP